MFQEVSELRCVWHGDITNHIGCLPN